MTYLNSLKHAVAIAGIGALAMTGTVAFASAGSGITVSAPLFTSHLTGAVEGNHDRVKFQTKDPTVVRVQSISFVAGGFSGWHHHPGIVIVSVASGSVTLTDANCGSVTYGPGLPAGAVFVERDDGANQASSAGGAVIYATSIVPNATPLVFRLEDPPRTC